MYNKPDMSNPEDKLAWIISEIINDSAPVGWEKYRPLSFLLIKKFDMVEKEQMSESEAEPLDWDRRWIIEATLALMIGSDIMSLYQLSKWSGVRAVIETAPLTDDENTELMQRYAAIKLGDE